MLGMHGTYAANTAVQNCDLLFAVGTRFDDRATGDLAKFAPHATVVHVDIDPASISRNVAVEIPIVGDARTVLEDLLPAPRSRRRRTNGCARRTSGSATHPLVEIERQRAALTHRGHPRNRRGLSRMRSSRPRSARTRCGPRCTTPFSEPRSFLTSGGLGTMGYGFPAAIGAQLGNPGRRVIDIAGDGSIQMNIQELATAVSEGLPVIVAILNNGYLGMVRQWQEVFYRQALLRRVPGADRRLPAGLREARTSNCPPYVPGFRASSRRRTARWGSASAVPRRSSRRSGRRVRSTDRPIFLDFQIEREANVWPMVPAGAGIDEMMNTDEREDRGLA